MSTGTQDKDTPQTVGDDPSEELFDPGFLSQLRSLFFKLRSRQNLTRHGAQPTPATGFTREFKDYRQYTPGDDYREIDWRLYARLEKLFIRLFEEVQEFHVHVVVDTSRSMVDPFGQKRVVALRLAAALSYLALINGHRVSLLKLGDRVEQEFHPLKGQGHVHNLLRRLEGLQFDGVTNLERAMRGFRPARDRKGIVFLLSDMFGQSLEDATEASSAMGRWPVESHVVQVVHPSEASPDLSGELQLLDVETGETRRMWLTKRDIEQYRASFDRFVEEVHQSCARHRINHVRWPTDHAFEEMFLYLLSRGSALAGDR
ncbi:MAG: DUF58 domain-containing protein [Planctomycetota bacterium]